MTEYISGSVTIEHHSTSQVFRILIHEEGIVSNEMWLDYNEFADLFNAIEKLKKGTGL